MTAIAETEHVEDAGAWTLTLEIGGRRYVETGRAPGAPGAPYPSLAEASAACGVIFDAYGAARKRASAAVSA